jgi:preprotein translocase subunit SecF
MNIIGKRYILFAISLAIIIPGFIIMAIYGLPLSIDFKGGSMLEVSFASGNAPQSSDIVAIYQSLGFTEDPQIQTTGSGKNIIVIRSTYMEEETRAKVVSTMEEKFNDKITVRQFQSVGPTVGGEVASRAAVAVAVASLIVILYIAFAFRGLQHALRYGICAIIALIHDIMIVFSITAIGCHFFGWQVDSLFLTALLTVIGFSSQDNIVVFDRIRENSSIYRKLPFETLVNHSVVQTLQRSINTQLMTVEFMLLSLILFGGGTIQQFCIILLIGMLSGTYSSIFIAASSLVVWENREWKTWFHRKGPQASSI